MSTYSRVRQHSASPLLSLISEGGKVMLQEATQSQELKKVAPYIVAKQNISSSLLQGSSYVDFEINNQTNIDLLRKVYAQISVNNTSASSITMVSPHFWFDYVAVLANGVEIPGARYPGSFIFRLLNSLYSTEDITPVASAGNWTPSTLQPSALSAGTAYTFTIPILTFLDMCQVPLHPNIVYTLRFQFNGGSRLKITGSGLVSEVNVTDFRLLLDGIQALGATKSALQARISSSPYLCRALLPGQYKQINVGAMTASTEYNFLMSLMGAMAGFYIDVADGTTGAALQYTFAELNRVDIRDSTGQSVALFDSSADNNTLLRKLLPPDQWTNPTLFNTLYVYPLFHSDDPEKNVLSNSSHGKLRYNNIERIYIEPTGNVTAGVLNIVPFQEYQITIDYARRTVSCSSDC